MLENCTTVEGREVCKDAACSMNFVTLNFLGAFCDNVLTQFTIDVFIEKGI